MLLFEHLTAVQAARKVADSVRCALAAGEGSAIGHQLVGHLHGVVRCAGLPSVVGSPLLYVGRLCDLLPDDQLLDKGLEAAVGRGTRVVEHDPSLLGRVRIARFSALSLSQTALASVHPSIHQLPHHVLR